MTDPFAPLDSEPASLMIGVFTSWRVQELFGPTLFSLKYAFAQGDLRSELALAFTDDTWVFTAPSAFTATLPIGRNHLDLIVTRLADSEAVLLRTSTIHCFSSLADRTSHSQIMLDKIESILSGRADSDVDSYTIKSRSISKMSVRELMEWREYYLAELGREPNPITGRRAGGNTVKVGFI